MVWKNIFRNSPPEKLACEVRRRIPAKFLQTKSLPPLAMIASGIHWLPLGEFWGSLTLVLIQSLKLLNPE